MWLHQNHAIGPLAECANKQSARDFRYDSAAVSQLLRALAQLLLWLGKNCYYWAWVCVYASVRAEQSKGHTARANELMWAIRAYKCGIARSAWDSRVNALWNSGLQRIIFLSESRSGAIVRSASTYRRADWTPAEPSLIKSSVINERRTNSRVAACDSPIGTASRDRCFPRVDLLSLYHSVSLFPLASTRMMR